MTVSADTACSCCSGVMGTVSGSRSLTGVVRRFVAMPIELDPVEAAFHSGSGIGWGEHDKRIYTGIARFFGASYRASLVDEWVPALGLEAVLRQGARVADVGCGQG